MTSSHWTDTDQRGCYQRIVTGMKKGGRQEEQGGREEGEKKGKEDGMQGGRERKKGA